MSIYEQLKRERETSVDDFLNRAKELTVRAHNKAEHKDNHVTVDEVYIVWFSKTLANWKALASTTTSSQNYYELTHDGVHGCTYVDTYKKLHNECIFDNE